MVPRIRLLAFVLVLFSAVPVTASEKTLPEQVLPIAPSFSLSGLIDAFFDLILPERQTSSGVTNDGNVANEKGLELVNIDGRGTLDPDG